MGVHRLVPAGGIPGPVCQPFWSWANTALLGIVVVAVVWIAAKFISYRLKLAAAWRAEQEREAIADEDTMREHTWDGDKAYQTDVAPEEMRRRIKDALVARANQGKLPPIV